jgi:diaminohydroxyphosphoribosylaminopyrimidine deaminase / 5-amino-6-(5-phosphoribosylamino)uracil reductase
MNDSYYLDLCAEIAEMNIDMISPKKIGVGAIIVKDNKIVGKGYRWTKVLQEEPYKDITYHAEHCAIMNAGPLCKDATLYVTMEPCNKRITYDWSTPDCCCDLIVKSGIKRVVYLESDNGLGGGGEEYLKSRGIEVEKSNDY